MSDSVTELLTIEERLAALEAKIDRLVSFCDKAEQVFEAMNEAIADNPMLSMMLGK